METTNSVQTPKILLCSLTHNGLLHCEMAGRFFTEASQYMQTVIKVKPSSLLASTCNEFWCSALNDRVSRNYKWFAMLHADIIPEPFFLDKLIRIADTSLADVLSVVIPIKSEEGVTSTAISGPDAFTRATRLTTAQINNKSFPKTFDVNDALDALAATNQLPFLSESPRLLVNTGCFIARLDGDWISETYFQIQNRIQTIGGRYYDQTESEDWFFSRLAAQNGAKVMATTEVYASHVGSLNYRNDQVWGNPIDKSGFNLNVKTTV